MSRKKKAKEGKPPTLPTNPEFQAFMGNLRGIMAVPKTEVERIIAEERAAKIARGIDPDEELAC